MDKWLSELERMQQGEITEYHIYKRLAKGAKHARNKKVLERIARDEKRHYGILKKATGKEFKPDMGKVRRYVFLARVFGLAFSLKYMENGEKGAQESYTKLSKHYPQVKKIVFEEEEHEAKIIDMISEERLDYASAIVLGLNDALVELTGALAGLTFALQNGQIIAVSGLMIGVAASLSMAASSYLSTREEATEDRKDPIKSALYTGVAYLLTVIFLITPYFLIPNVYLALIAMMATAMLIVALYIFYITTAKSQRFLPRFVEMASISLVVAIISFAFGFVVRAVFGIEV